MMSVRQLFCQILSVLLPHINFFDARRVEDASVAEHGEGSGEDEAPEEESGWGIDGTPYSQGFDVQLFCELEGEVGINALVCEEEVQCLS